MTKPGDVIKFCFKCGSNKFVFDGNRSFQCLNCGFQFYINSSSAVAAIITDDKGRILLTERAHEPNKGFLDLPGGFVDPMESAEDAIIREIREELNLEITQLTYLVSFPNEYIYSGFSVFTTDFGFIAEVKTFDTIQWNDDISGFQFIEPDKINFERLSSYSIASIIKFYLFQN